MSEVPADERLVIRKDIQRSQPPFFSALAPADLDPTGHAMRLERVLCAWTQYDQEIGYVQAMNLVASTLLLLLDGDDEATFWTLVTLLRQLPASFYSRAPQQLLGFWAEVEVLSQLATRLLGLEIRDALLQISPQWLLSFWVGTLPLELIVMIWDHMLRNAHSSTPSVLNLQVRSTARALRWWSPSSLHLGLAPSICLNLPPPPLARRSRSSYCSSSSRS